jgi:hypothetical protein
MKYLLSALFALSPAAVLAHSGHVERVDGHSHTLAELAVLGMVPLIAVMAIAGVAYWLLARRNG